jgi:putative ABC transport system permease protein
MANTRLIYENIKISLQSIKGHLLRTVLTVMIIAFGIMALVGILTAIDVMKYFLNENFSMMGSNTFNIQSRALRVQIGGHRNRPKSFEPITFQQAIDFKEQYTFPAKVSVFTRGTGIATLKYGSVKTDPNIQVLGVDENYIASSGQEIALGRNINKTDVENNGHVVVIGSEVAAKLFPDKPDPVGEVISVGPGKYKVVGVLKERGSSIGFSGDKSCLMPLTNVRVYFSRPKMNYTISVLVTDGEMMDAAIGEATGLFRKIRRDNLKDDDSFAISKSDNIAGILIDLTWQIQLGATFIGLITLFGAGIGLMNIMLVSVTERTREIGIRKALGATRNTIKNQFLAEAVVIAQIGGVIGVIAGILVGNAISYFTDSPFIIPWLWIVAGLILTFFVALISGIIPAYKAASLDPIESLRYE